MAEECIRGYMRVREVWLPVSGPSGAACTDAGSALANAREQFNSGSSFLITKIYYQLSPSPLLQRTCGSQTCPRGTSICVQLICGSHLIFLPYFIRLSASTYKNVCVTLWAPKKVKAVTRCRALPPLSRSQCPRFLIPEGAAVRFSGRLVTGISTQLRATLRKADKLKPKRLLKALWIPVTLQAALPACLL